MEGWLDALQWPAMAVTVLASWLVASKQPLRRRWGFWLFLASNVLWVAWGFHTKAWALVALQFALAALNIRGAGKADDQAQAQGDKDGDGGADASKAPA